MKKLLLLLGMFAFCAVLSHAQLDYQQPVRVFRNGAASTPDLVLAGTPFAGTGTTAWPLFFAYDPAATASSTLPTGGSWLGVNDSVATRYFLWYGVNGASRFAVGGGGIITASASQAADAIHTFTNAAGGVFLSLTASNNFAAYSIISNGGTQKWFFGLSGGTAFAITDSTNGLIPLTIAPNSPASSLSISTAGTSVIKPLTATNCSSAASPAVCGSAAAGSVVVAAAATTVVVNDTAVTANSQIMLTFDSSLGTKLGVTCNTTPAVLSVSARVPGTSFTVTSAAPTTNPDCLSYSVVN